MLQSSSQASCLRSFSLSFPISFSISLLACAHKPTHVQRLARTIHIYTYIYIHIYTVYIRFSCSPSIRSYAVYIYGSGSPYMLHDMFACQPNQMSMHSFGEAPSVTVFDGSSFSTCFYLWENVTHMFNCFLDACLFMYH